MTNLVGRLRDVVATDCERLGVPASAETAREAADEIERLSAPKEIIIKGDKYVITPRSDGTVEIAWAGVAAEPPQPRDPYRPRNTGDVTTNPVSEERLRNTRAWAAARIGSLSGVIVSAIDELLELRGEAEVADEQLAQLRGFAEAHKHCRGSDEPTCKHSTAETHARWCIECGALYDGTEWIHPRRTVSRPAEPPVSREQRIAQLQREIQEHLKEDDRDPTPPHLMAQGYRSGHTPADPLVPMSAVNR